MRKQRCVVVASAVLVMMTAGCGGAAGQAAPVMSGMPSGSTGSGSNSQAPVAGNAVNITNFAFVPGTLTVKVGTTVTWTNQDQETHDVSATGGAFRSSALSTGDRFTFTFTRPGQYGYLCTIHPFMTATVVVTP